MRSLLLFIQETLTFKDDNLKVAIIEEDKAEEFALAIKEAMKKSDIL